MSKELEALEELKEHLKYEWLDNFANTQYYDILKQALQRLETIDNANPSEALECLGNIYTFSEDYIDGIYQFENEYNTIKQALLKAQEQEKVLEIIKEKYVHIPQLLCAFENQLEEENPLEVYYNGQVGINVPMPLTQEEFDLLKRWYSND